MIIQSIALLDQMDKDLNTFAMRVREWYSWHFPELKDIVKDNYMFARSAAFIQDKISLTKDDADKLDGLKEIIGDDDTANAVVNAAKTSMGMDCSSVDMVNIVNFTQRMVKLAEYRKQLALYLSEKMNLVAPNLSALIGDTVAARLISKVRFNRLQLAFTKRFFPLTLLLLPGWIIDELGQGTCFHSPDSGGRESIIPCPQDKGEHPKVWSHLPLDVYWPC